MVAKKRKSKRQTLQQKYKIIKRTKEHHRKIKKGKVSATANQIQRKKALAKAENRIPNAWPYKEDLLKEIESAKERMEEMKQRQKEKRKEEMVRFISSLSFFTYRSIFL
jgi:nuclear GTP-binding protein